MLVFSQGGSRRCLFPAGGGGAGGPVVGGSGGGMMEGAALGSVLAVVEVEASLRK